MWNGQDERRGDVDVVLPLLFIIFLLLPDPILMMNLRGFGWCGVECAPINEVMVLPAYPSYGSAFLYLLNIFILSLRPLKEGEGVSDERQAAGWNCVKIL